MFPTSFQIIDISQPVTSKTACFPGDVPFSKALTVSYQESKVLNLTAMTLSPHVGTHADAPSHIKGTVDDTGANIGSVPLDAYVGQAAVVDLSAMESGGITGYALEAVLASLGTIGGALPPRLLVKTLKQIRYENWEGDYPYFTLDAVEYLVANGVRLVGIDTPSVDRVDSKDLPTHHAMDQAGMCWLENLDLTQVEPGVYFLVAAPLKLMELEAAPVRALLLKATD